MIKAIMVLMSIWTTIVGAQHSLDSLHWMAGHWICDEGGEVQEEYWMDPSGAIMPGLHRDVRSGGQSSFEYMRIVEKDGVMLYHASPGGKRETIFRADSLGDFFVRFVNAKHDYPQRIVYELDVHGNLVAFITDVQGGNQKRWVFSKREE